MSIKSRNWTKNEILFLKKEYYNFSLKELASKLGRTVRSVSAKAVRLGYKKNQFVKIGDIKNGWKVIDIYMTKSSCGNMTKRVKVKSLTSNVEKEYRADTFLHDNIKQPNFKRKTNRKIIHGMTNTRLYRIWDSMKGRCYRKGQSSYKDYGGRGITVCEDWKKDFVKFKDWAFANGYNDNLSIDRIDVNGNYCPENCRWTTQKEQCRNTRKSDKKTKYTAFGESKNLYKWSDDERCVVVQRVLKTRLDNGWDIEKALTEPSRETIAEIRYKPFYEYAEKYHPEWIEHFDNSEKMKDDPIYQLFKEYRSSILEENVLEF